MKKTFKAYIAPLVLIALAAILLGACGGDLGGNTTPTPVAGDFDISGTGPFTRDGDPKEVSIEPKTDKSAGDITIWYEGISPTVYEKSETPPAEPGTYAVTFDVAAAPGWNPATGLSAGTLVINSDDDPIEDPDTFTVTFDKNGGDTEADPPTIEVEDGNTVTLPTPPTREGYRFIEWNIDRDGEGSGFDETTTVTEDITVYAQWEPEQQQPLSGDASLASLTINGATTTTGFPSGHPNEGTNGLAVWSSGDYTSIAMTQSQFNGQASGNTTSSLTISATPNDPGARILGYAVVSSSTALYTGSTGNYSVNTDGWSKYDAAGITDNYNWTGTFTNNTTRIFVWVEAEDGTWGFYRIQQITITADPGDPDDPTPSSDASLSAITINGGGTITWPTNAHPQSGGVVWTAGDYTTIANAPAETGTLVVLATPTDSKAKIIGYAVTSSSTNFVTSNAVDLTKWTAIGTYNATGITGAYTWTGTLGSNRVFIWVQAEDGTEGFYRVNTVSFSN